MQWVRSLSLPPRRAVSPHFDRWLLRFRRPALFISAAETYGERVIDVVLSGYDSDGAEGLRVIKERSGVALVQKPEEAEQPSMPCSAIMAGHLDACLSGEDIGARVAVLCGGFSVS